MNSRRPPSKLIKPIEPKGPIKKDKPESSIPTMTGPTSHDPHSLAPTNILQLQRTIGNRAVGSMLGVSKSPSSSGDIYIQRKFTGDLAEKSDEEIAELLREAGYVVNNITKLKLANLRKTGDSYSDLISIANALQLKKKSSGESEPKTPSTDTTSEVTPESGTTGLRPTGLRSVGLRNTGPSTTSKDTTDKSSSPFGPTVFGGTGLRSVKQETGKKLDGGTTWFQDSKSVKVTPRAWAADPPQDFGQLRLNYRFSDAGLQFTADVFSNPKLIWEQGDKVTITLQFKDGTSHLIGDLRVQKTANIVELTCNVSFAALASILRTKIPSGTVEEKRNALAEVSSQMGVLAMWRNQHDVGEQHRSGGIDQKGGSGLINLSAIPISEETLKKTEDEDIRNVGWNENEIATDKRPLVNSFPNLIKLGEEIATTLEAESEYMVEKDGYEKILSAMLTISGEDKEDLLKKYGIEKAVKPSKKTYVDTYYDLDTGDKEDKRLRLLENNVVFRHRSVPKNLNNGEGDPEGTNLIAIKGKSVTEEGESLRLAAQFQAKYDLLSEENQEEVLKFLRSEQVDNPFARTLLDALGENKGVLDEAKRLKKAIKVTSTRTKYKLWLANSTMIDLSVDEAEGEMDGYSNKKTVYSFEFGVGHPGLSTGSTGSGGLSEEDPKLEQLKKELSEIHKDDLGKKTVKSDHIKKRQQTTSRLVHRPYHVPKDLRNKNLFQKGDYIQYKNLRDLMIKDLFDMDKTELDRGGNKAKLLAQKIMESEPV